MRRPDLTHVLAAALPVAVGLALAFTTPEAPHVVVHPPAAVELSSAELVCPGTTDVGGLEVNVGSDAGPGASGAVDVHGVDTVTVSSLRSGQRVSVAAADAPTVVRAEDEIAPGLVAAVSGHKPVSAVACSAPQGSQWFTGVGAGPTQASTIQLTNPNVGPAVADIDVFGEQGLVNAPRLRGIAIPSGRTVSLDLAALIPQTGSLAVRVQIVRGQAGVALLDSDLRLTGGVASREWVPAQASEERTALLLGVHAGGGRHTLTLVNPGDSQVTARLKLVTADATFAPDGVEPITVPAHTVVRSVLDTLLDSPTAAGVIGLEVDASGPVASSLRSIVAGDLSFVVPAPNLSASTVAVVPEGAAQVVLAGSPSSGQVIVTALSARGTEIASQSVDVVRGIGAAVRLPPKAAMVRIEVVHTTVQAALMVSGDGSVVMPIAVTERSGAVPAVVFGR